MYIDTYTWLPTADETADTDLHSREHQTNTRRGTARLGSETRHTIVDDTRSWTNTERALSMSLSSQQTTRMAAMVPRSRRSAHQYDSKGLGAYATMAPKITGRRGTTRTEHDDTHEHT